MATRVVHSWQRRLLVLCLGTLWCYSQGGFVPCTSSRAASAVSSRLQRCASEEPQETKAKDEDGKQGFQLGEPKSATESFASYIVIFIVATIVGVASIPYVFTGEQRYQADNVGGTFAGGEVGEAMDTLEGRGPPGVEVFDSRKTGMF
eukprot:TRINITY_DN99130_c0_g1_i1.p2 TRINITY_DN99130_c0_g1~~TRINITY_DN99130_c0_g1_i1.p2  ORF type:complete len:148 (-),score=21.11 TRINITY_DN99130_c0_g1_i1:96-539(-)